jgi:hypothetical protein
VRSNAWIWDFSSTHSTIAFSGGCRYSPTMSVTLATSCGSVENLNVSARHGCNCQIFHSRVTVTCDTSPRCLASSRDDQCVTPKLSGGGASVVARISSLRAWVSFGGAPDRGASPSPSSPSAS